MKLDSFTIFLIVLIVFVILILLVQRFSCPPSKEGMINFHTNQNTGSTVYIPAYSASNTKTVISLYDSLYFDYKNGNVIEVIAPSSTSGTNDLTGASITGISIADRDGLEIVNITAQPLNSDGTVPGYSSPQSLVATVSSLYNQLTYTTTNTATTDPYQVFYISWNQNTYLYLVDLNSSNGSYKCGKGIQAYYITPNGLITTTTNATTLPNYTSSKNMVTINNTLSKDIKYLSGASIFQIATSLPPSGTTSATAQTSDGSASNATTVYFDISYGNIVVNGPAGLSVYNRSGSGTALSPSEYNRQKISNLSSMNVFILTDIYPYAAILVIAYQQNTIVSIITPGTDNYTLLTSVRFNSKQMVNSLATDMDVSKNANYHDGWDNNWKGDNEWKKETGNFGKDAECSNEISCKWYWFFNSIGEMPKGNSGNILSDDYFLKTEVVPPVCPQCPMCPNVGVCQNCGGNGGSGTCNPTSAPTLTPSPNVPGTFKDSSGNVFVLYTDKNGKKSYVPLSSVSNTNTVQASSASPSNLTLVNTDGSFLSSADPNTVGGGLTLSALSFDQFGTAAVNTVGSSANTVVNTSGNVANNVVDGATKIAGGAERLIGGTINTAADLVGGTIGTAADLAQGVGSGIMQLANSNNRGVSEAAPGGSAITGTAPGGSAITGTAAGGYIPTTSDKTFGNIPGKTAVDNYSYYGALQSKGSNYMPVTADFSSFRK